MVDFPTRVPDCDSHSPALLYLFTSSDAIICSTMAFYPLQNSDHVVVSVSIDFTIILIVDWDSLLDQLRDIPWEDIFKLNASVAASDFCEWVQVGIDVYIFHRKH